MPCFTVRRMDVEFKHENFDLLADAIRQLGYDPVRNDREMHFDYMGTRVSIANGKVYCDASKIGIVNQLNRAYSMAAVGKLKTKYGWSIKQTAHNKMVLRR